MDFTIVNYYGQQQSKCGYCKGLECSAAHGMHAYNMLPQDYQDLIDRGWRRSGHYCYKPNNKTTCCPCYTIKCDALGFKLTKSHKKILKRMNRFLRDGKKDQNEIDATNNKDKDSNVGSDDDVGGIREEPIAPNVPIPNFDLDAVAAANPKYCKKNIGEKDEKRLSPITAARREQQPECDPTSSGLLVGSKNSDNGLKPPCKKAKQMRLERKQAKLLAKGIDPATATKQQKPVNAEKTISDYIADVSESDKHKLKLTLVHVKSKQFKQTLDSTYELYQKYQTRVHNDPPDNVKEYLSFLQRSPLKYAKTQDGPSIGYGSFHMQYWLDDTLIAVAVIDILPYCVSSVYFFYDPDYSFLSLGTYGSLREIQYVQKLAAKCPALKYYYMGFYIHSCPKMRYKGKLQPSYLLCPETYTWNLLNDDIRLKLDENKYQRLHANDAAKDEDDFLENHLDAVLLLTEQNIVVSYREYIQITGEIDDRDSILEYGRLVGRTCAHRMLYWKI